MAKNHKHKQTTYFICPGESHLSQKESTNWKHAGTTMETGQAITSHLRLSNAERILWIPLDHPGGSENLEGFLEMAKTIYGKYVEC